MSFPLRAPSLRILIVFPSGIITLVSATNVAESGPRGQSSERGENTVRTFPKTAIIDTGIMARAERSPLFRVHFVTDASGPVIYATRWTTIIECLDRR